MIVDANIILSAMLGRSLRDLITADRLEIELNVPAHQMRETRMVLQHRFPALAEELKDRMQQIDDMVTVIEPDHYSGLEAVARGRLTAAGQRDWPVLAAAMALDQPILSNDRDFFGVGVAIWSMPVLRHELESLNA